MPLENAPVTTQDSAAGQSPPSPAPETEIAPPAGAGAGPGAPAAKSGDAAPPAAQPPAPAKPAAIPENPTVPAAGEVGEGITLQVVALRTKSDADALVNILKGRGYPVFLVTPEYAHADDNLFRVLVGPFKTREDADKVRAKLVQDGFKPFIRH
jgi:cell division septation protein DedD